MTKHRSASEHYRREMERRAKLAKPESEVMAAARREYEALLEAQATKGKGGRPRKKKAPEKDPETDEGSDEMEDLAGDE
jgi:hypothetical protein